MSEKLLDLTQAENVGDGEHVDSATGTGKMSRSMTKPTKWQCAQRLLSLIRVFVVRSMGS